ncbi:MAG TPA: class I SAM-dependent methyltransferase [Gaiellaceae bacterium]|nr:class I SAM-dependent methyltransferase [Gaiellaceae bacterium]
MRFADLEQNLGRRFARLATNAVVARPRLWGAFRPLMRRQFDRLAPEWQARRRPEAFAALEEALAAIETQPLRVLDLGTGTGAAAFAAARRFPQADVVGVDLAERMLAEARENTPAELADRVRFEAADGSHLPFEDEGFELVVLANMIPFFDELARVAGDGGHVVFSFSAGPETPIWVPPERLRRELGARGFAEFADFAAAGGTALLARKTPQV